MTIMSYIKLPTNPHNDYNELYKVTKQPRDGFNELYKFTKQPRDDYNELYKFTKQPRDDYNELYRVTNKPTPVMTIMRYIKLPSNPHDDYNDQPCEIMRKPEILVTSEGFWCFESVLKGNIGQQRTINILDINCTRDKFTHNKNRRRVDFFLRRSEKQ